MKNKKIIYNTNTILKILDKNPEIIDKLYIFKINKKTIYLYQKALNKNINIIYIKKINNNKLTYLRKYNNVICRTNIDITIHDESININPLSKILILDRLQDPYNLAACLRTAEAYLIDLVIINDKYSTKISNLITKISNGADLFIKIKLIKNISDIIKKIKEQNIKIIGLSAKADKELNDNIIEKPFAIIMGSEKNGISNEIKNLCDDLYKIKLFGQSKSINISVATGIILSKIKN